MVYDTAQRFGADGALSDIGVAVFCRAQAVFAVINMKNSDLFPAEYPVEFLHDPVKVIHNVVACVIYMAGIKAYPQLVTAGDSVIDGGKLFKAPTDFRAFAGHGFQSYAYRCIWGEHRIQPPDDLADARLASCAHMGAGMKYQHAAAHGGGPFQLQRQKIHSQGVGIGIYRVGQIDNIGRMHYKILDPVLFHIIFCSIYIQFADRLPLCILGRAGIHHEGVGPVGHGFARRTKQHFLSCHFYMRSDFYHKKYSCIRYLFRVAFSRFSGGRKSV